MMLSATDNTDDTRTHWRTPGMAPASSDCTVRLEPHDRHTVAFVRGRLTFGAGGQVEAALSSLVDRPGQRVVIDLAQVCGMDSSGLGALVRLALAAREHGSRIQVTNPPKVLSCMLAVTHLDKLFDICACEPARGACAAAE